MTTYDKGWYDAQLKAYRHELMHQCTMSTLIAHKCLVCKIFPLSGWLLEMTEAEKLTIELVADVADSISSDSLVDT